MEKFQSAVNVVLPVVSEANKRERLMMGKAMSGPANLKRKRDRAFDVQEESGHDYFFAKFLTSSDLLELEASMYRLGYPPLLIQGFV